MDSIQSAHNSGKNSKPSVNSEKMFGAGKSIIERLTVLLNLLSLFLFSLSNNFYIYVSETVMIKVVVFILYKLCSQAELHA